MNVTLIALEIKVGNQIKVFVNPSEYIFGEGDHWGYCLYHIIPDFNAINGMDLRKTNAENFFIMSYIKNREVGQKQKEVL
jgi:hypothetical protein